MRVALALAAIAGSLAAAGGALGCRVEPDEQPVREAGVARAAVVGGELDSEDAAVVALVARRTRCEEEDVTLLCTGTLVAPRVVLTAAHCLDVFGEDGQYEVFFGSRVGASDGRFELVTAARRHPAYDPETHEYDLALLRLARPAPVPPQALPVEPLEMAVGQPVRVVGFGATEVGSLPAGEKRSGQMVVSEMTATALRTTPGPGMSCAGDSGGPVLVTVGGREWLLGVTASGDPGCRSYAFNVRADVLANGFVWPFVVETEAVPAGYDEERLVTADLCASECAGPGDCPAGLACVRDERGGGRCMLLSLREGSFGEECTSDTQCPGEPCARVLPEGPGACRCFRACGRGPGAGGCAAGGAGAPGMGLAWLGALVLWRAIHRRPRPTGSALWPTLEGILRKREVEITAIAGVGVM